MISWSTQRIKTLNTWLSKHLMAIITDSTSRLRRNVPIPWQCGDGGGAAAVWGVEQDQRRWRRHLGSGSGSVAGVAAVSAWQWWGGQWQQQHGGGGGGGRAVAARRRQCGGSSVAVVAVWRQRSSGQHGSGVGQCGGSTAAESIAAMLEARWWWRWQHAGCSRLRGCGGSLAALQHQGRQQSGGSCAAAARHHGGDKDTGSNSNGGSTTNNQQSTKSGSGNGNGNNNNNNK